MEQTVLSIELKLVKRSAMTIWHARDLLSEKLVMLMRRNAIYTTQKLVAMSKIQDGKKFTFHQNLQRTRSSNLLITIRL